MRQVFIILLILSWNSLFNLSLIAQSPFICNIQEGFNFDPNHEEMVGFIHNFQFTNSGPILNNDFNVMNPIEDPSDMNVCGVIDYCHWEDLNIHLPIELSFQVSTTNKNTIHNHLLSGIQDRSVYFEFIIYDYDPESGDYFKVLEPNSGILEGMIHEDGGELDIYIDSESGMEVPYPENFNFYVKIDAIPEMQEFNYRVSPYVPYQKFWQYLPLAINHINLVSVKKDQGVHLSWQVETNDKVEIIKVQRKNDTGKWGTIKTFDYWEKEPDYIGHYLDENEIQVGNYYYRIKVLMEEGITKFSNVVSVHADEVLLLEPLSPNPMKELKQISFNLPEKSSVEIFLTDIYGTHFTLLKETLFKEGRHCIEIAHMDLPAGIYFCHLKTRYKDPVFQKFIIID